MNPLVSIIIPTYNSGNFLKDSIQSILCQTYNPIEILVVDDGSTDNTKEVAKKFGNEITYIHQQNRGVSSARNTGFLESKGDFICFLDADDWFYPSNIKNKVEVFSASNSISLVHGKVIIADEKLHNTGEVLVGKHGYVLEDLLNLVPPAIPCPSNALIRRNVLEDIGLFDENLSTSADYDLWIRIAQKYEVGMVNQSSIKYRQHSSNMFSNIDLFINDMEYIFKKHSQLNFKVTKFKVYKSSILSSLKKLHFLKSMSLFFKYIIG